MGTVQKGGRHVFDSLKVVLEHTLHFQIDVGSFKVILVLQTGSQTFDYYSDADLTLGAVLNVYGRKFLICDCDEFTKEFYRKKYGVSELIKAIDFLNPKYLITQS